MHDPNMRLSHNFKLSEFLVSQTAMRHGIDMTPSTEIVENLHRLCRHTLQPIRNALCERAGRDVAVFVTSGYRPPALNRRIGGSPTSQHMRGEAADLRAAGFSAAELWAVIADLYESDAIPVHQLICEFGQWVHVSCAPAGKAPAGQLLSAVRELNPAGYMQTFYRKGLRV